VGLRLSPATPPALEKNPHHLPSDITPQTVETFPTSIVSSDIQRRIQEYARTVEEKIQETVWRSTRSVEDDIRSIISQTSDNEARLIVRAEMAENRAKASEECERELREEKFVRDRSLEAAKRENVQLFQQVTELRREIFRLRSTVASENSSDVNVSNSGPSCST
jgi:ATP-dependent protease HslVU (ClpYQ) ATPase subunit